MCILYFLFALSVLLVLVLVHYQRLMSIYLLKRLGNHRDMSSMLCHARHVVHKDRASV